jgi:hypothetical protein
LDFGKGGRGAESNGVEKGGQRALRKAFGESDRGDVFGEFGGNFGCCERVSVLGHCLKPMFPLFRNEKGV